LRQFSSKGFMILLFSAAVFVSAALLFIVQPMAAKLILPRLGGSPAVWNTSMLFFQTALLLGYAYAHVVGTRLKPRAQLAVHAVVIAIAAFLIPIAIPRESIPPTTGSPIPWLLLTLAIAAGGPFFVVATTGPLLQRWFAGTGHKAAHDPYFLYAASNAGSLIGLLGYPLIIEPALSLRGQSLAWAIGFAAFALLALAAGFVFAARARAAIATTPPSTTPDSSPAESATIPAPSDPNTDAPAQDTIATTSAPTAAPLEGTRPTPRWLWIALALLPSSHLLAVSLFISTDLASAPLLWVVPLSIYLLTFIIAFSRFGRLSLFWMPRLLPILIVGLLVAFLMEATRPMWMIASLHLATLFVGALACHARLAALRPPAARLTEYYLMISVGGMLGGVFNALIAPLIFDKVLEYPIVLAFVCLAALWVRRPQAQLPTRVFDFALPVLALGLYFGGLQLATKLDVVNPMAKHAIAIGPTVILAFLCLIRAERFALAVGLLLLASQLAPLKEHRLLLSERTFFGVHRVYRSPGGNFHSLVHGSTTHGLQNINPDRRRFALAYYHRTGPIGQVFRHWVSGETLGAAPQPEGVSFGPKPPVRVGLIGLGTGALAVYGRPGDSFTFYEIDQGIVDIAENPAYFTYLTDCLADYRIVLGDGRLTLTKTPDATYDLIVLDAFSSDSIPVHLLTREAMELYRSKLAPGGIIAVHISNRYLDLEPVLAAHADALNMHMVEQQDTAAGDDETEGKYGSDWILLSRAKEDLGPLNRDARWLPPLPPGPNSRRVNWTDSSSNILSVMQW
jgi:hypothetical protein